jgi:tRNA dimethylallyltransferase
MASVVRTAGGGPASARPFIILTGPTASGKSALALALARRLGGTIINADAMQCYAELTLITARPSAADEAAAPHRLYGVRAAATPANAAWWRAAALAEMEACALPILCGGTGLYLSTLVNGIADIPEPPPAARAEARALLAVLGAPALHARLDPPTAARTDPHNGQRVARAYEVLIGTGQGLAAWQAAPPQRLAGWRPYLVRLAPDRAALAASIAARFDAMLAAGALDEVADFLALGLPPNLPLMRAHGVPELARHLRGEMTLGAAAAAAKLATLQYTKRQMTWFRHQKLVDDADMQILSVNHGVSTQQTESLTADLVNFINTAG